MATVMRLKQIPQLIIIGKVANLPHLNGIPKVIISRSYSNYLGTLVILLFFRCIALEVPKLILTTLPNLTVLRIGFYM